MKKKVASIVITSTLLLPTFTTSYVSANASMDVIEQAVSEQSKIDLTNKEKQLMENVKISKEDATKIVKKFYPIPPEYKQENISFNSNWYTNNGSVWQVSFSNQDENNHGRYHATLDANSGNILEFNHYIYNSNHNQTYPPKAKWDDAKKVANEFLQKHFPTMVDDVKYNSFIEDNQKPPLNGHFTYDVRFERNINGYPFTDNFITIRVNGNGDISGFDYRWNDNVSFPKPDKIISKEEAISKIRNTLPIHLQYKTLHEMGRFNPELGRHDAPIVLSYETRFYYPFIDAKTGQWLNHSGETVTDNLQDTIMEPLLDEPIINEDSEENKQLTADEAVEILKSHFTFPDDLTLENVSYDENYNGNKQAVWRFNWRNEETRFWMSAAVNAVNGDVMDFYHDRYYEVKEEMAVNLSYDDAKQIAIEKLKELAPSKLHLVTLETNHYQLTKAEEVREYHFNLRRINDGIIVPDQRINISISSETGEILRFHTNWFSDYEFPKKEGVVSIDQAIDAYLEQYVLEAKYVPIHQNKYEIQADETEEKEHSQQVILVYELRQKPSYEPIYLDAVKGKWASARTGDVVEEQTKATDIEGHWAEKELQLMIDHNAIKVDESGHVNPAQEITRGEMIKMLMLTQNPHTYFYKMSYELSDQSATFSDVNTKSEYFPYVELAVRNGLIDKSSKEFNPDELVTREELAELIVRALQLHSLSQVEDLFNIDFKDEEDVDQQGIVALVQHLNIMNGINGYFYPDKHVTKAEAAKVYYEYLKHRGKYQK